MEQDVVVRWVWLTILNIADDIRSDRIDMTSQAIARRAVVSEAETRRALAVLAAPDPASRSRADDGRRIIYESVPEGFEPRAFTLVNWQAYDAIRTAEEQRDVWREEKSGQRKNSPELSGDCPGLSGMVSDSPVPSQESKSKSKREKRSTPAGTLPEGLLTTWNQNRGPLPEAKAISGGRATHARARLAEVPDLARWSAAVKRLALSPFATGGNDRGWKADIDFLLRPDTLTKIEEGKYDDHKTSVNGNGTQVTTPTTDDVKRCAELDAMIRAAGTVTDEIWNSMSDHDRAIMKAKGEKEGPVWRKAQDRKRLDEIAAQMAAVPKGAT